MRRTPSNAVMAGLVPAIHALPLGAGEIGRRGQARIGGFLDRVAARRGVDGREPGHDVSGICSVATDNLRASPQ